MPFLTLVVQVSFGCSSVVSFWVASSFFTLERLLHVTRCLGGSTLFSVCCYAMLGSFEKSPSELYTFAARICP